MWKSMIVPVGNIIYFKPGLSLCMYIYTIPRRIDLYRLVESGTTLAGRNESAVTSFHRNNWSRAEDKATQLVAKVQMRE
ncbi:hypothetical protein BDV33DRAFT_81646 [Aspergillus novoparasiticus]|uniref:Uncharacterized protein n=1 Tax=Aspergillus novoparasiticus TaxID=986946 RepID=A0A5N6EXI2_9EURO|nr:hypothetical protein BDV33DRAFT_81646 [Aspergillus novoparasiticus]